MSENGAKQYVVDLMAGAHNKGDTERERQMMETLGRVGGMIEE